MTCNVITSDNQKGVRDGLRLVCDCANNDHKEKLLREKTNMKRQDMRSVIKMCECIKGRCSWTE